MDDIPTELIEAFLAIGTLIVTPFAILIYRKISDREQEEIDARILSTPRRQPEAATPTQIPATRSGENSGSTQPLLVPDSATGNDEIVFVNVEDAWPSPPWEDLVSRVLLSTNPVDCSLKCRWMTDEEEAHDEAFHDRLTLDFAKDLRDCIYQLHVHLGSPSALLDDNSTEEMVRFEGPNEEAQWQRPDRTIYLAWTVSDSHGPYSLDFGVVLN